MYKNEDILQQCAIAEGSQFNWHSQEKDLVVWWLRQSERMVNLKTVDGANLIVLEAGYRNDGPGPDIFQARILLDDFEISGDVEMHIKANDWYTHGHQYDERYCNVMLHVIMGGDAGPDIPTLVVDREFLGSGQCISIRRVTPHELLALAYTRFKSKQKHLKILSTEGEGYGPLLLGMIEVIMTGGNRFRNLQQAAQMLDLQHWPDCREWQGSNLSYPSRSSKEMLLKRILKAPELFQPNEWPTISRNSIADKLVEMQCIGLSLNQCKEWLVNIFAPFIGDERGFQLWREMKIFRRYALEKRMLHRLGVNEIRFIAEQQGLLAWRKNYCRSLPCSNCPLTQYHQTLTHIN